MSSDNPFKPALLVVDLQEDFCPPSGPLSVPGGRDIAPLINDLLAKPFTLKVATKDWHPADHISFASKHRNAKPFESFADIPNPNDPSQVETSRLWPDHCVQNSPGADLIPELDASKLDHTVTKGMDSRVEMYSAFHDPFDPPVYSSDLEKTMKDAGVTHVYVTGLATDYCVMFTAIDSVKAGFTTYLVSDAVRGVDPGDGSKEAFKKMEASGVIIIDSNSDVVKRVGQTT